MSARPLPSEDPRGHQPNKADSDSCSTPINPEAPAGSEGSLGAKSDCNGRPTTDDSVVEAKDEMGPALTPPAHQSGEARR